MDIESHPLQPFIPEGARLLMLGSFPPARHRWSMDFFYPNFQNDMWRIFGLVFFGDKDHFVDNEARTFRREEIIELLNREGIALYDTATKVIRTQNTASDKDLEVVTPTDLDSLLKRMPMLEGVVTTGQKATDLFRDGETDDEFRSYYSDPNFITLGVVRQDRLVACGTASFRREEAELFAPRLPERVPVEHVGYIEYIQVVKSERGKGIQPALFHALESALAQRGARYFTGLVSPYNSASRGNFTKGGYREVGSIVMPNGFERLLMAKKASNENDF